MPNSARDLSFVCDGWDTYHQSLILAIEPLSADQLSYRVHADMPSVGELAWHIGEGRVDWFNRMEQGGAGPAVDEKAGTPSPLKESGEGGIVLASSLIQEAEAGMPQGCTAAHLCDWLGRTWAMVESHIRLWTVEDLAATYRQSYQGTVYAVSRQWTVWRIMAHDIHHGGQLSELLAAQSIFPLELTVLGGHLTEPEIVR